MECEKAFSFHSLFKKYPPNARSSAFGGYFLQVEFSKIHQQKVGPNNPDPSHRELELEYR
ncbi:hypothetical protein CLOSTMETH_01425 [[Clostridium] methylpentosum DSM 5476]|uniref:Uncharacterized protein n=1 Tax=[Clostridium] methylpentosum DSM 5476 TaxID=537013 RepID=C0EC56_9FIRM|nr:hypothetical protein CLOSTMETH_01425 [[Clostridium] methylpentosum DSM 5476]